VVHGEDGQDEVSTTGPTQILELEVKGTHSRIRRYTLRPEEFGIPKARLEEIKGRSPAENAGAAAGVLQGKPGPVRDAVLFNAAAVLYVAGAVNEIKKGLALAAEAVDRGKAGRVLDQVKALTRKP